MVDAVAIVHQGPGAEATGDGTNIWSHRSAIVPVATGDGVSVSDYIIQPETLADTGKLSTIGVFCHEYGHALGLPDLYDYDTGDTASEGVGIWSLMAGGSWGGPQGQGDSPSHMDCLVQD